MSRFPGRSLKSLCAEMFVTLEDPLYFRWLIASPALIAMASPLLPLHRLSLFGALWVPAVPAAFCGSLYDIARVRRPGKGARIGAFAAIVVSVTTYALIANRLFLLSVYLGEGAVIYVSLAALVGTVVAWVTARLRRWSWSERRG